MNLRNQKRTRSLRSQDDISPFLPQTQTNSDRPRLKFDSPEKTEEWLASREKTDYTYSRSSSYTTTSLDSGYQVPIMSRLSQGSVLRDTSSPMRRGQQHFQREVSASPNRRSDRLAKKTTHNESSFTSRGHTSRSIQVSRHSTSASASMSHDHLAASAADESVHGSSSSTIASSASRMMSSLHHSARLRSGLHSDIREHSISHIYGLDANDESELSDTESSSAVTSRVGLTNKGASSEWTSVDHAHDHTHLASYSSSSSTVSLLLLPVYATISIVTSVLYFITTVIRTSWSSIAGGVYGSTSAVDSMSVSTSSANSVSSSIVNAFSSLVHIVSVSVYRFLTWLIGIDVRWLLFVKRSTLGVCGRLASLLGLSWATQKDRSAAAMSATMLREKRRRGTPCCLCLLLLLGTLAALYLLLAAAPFLLAAVSRNETKVTSPLHDVNQQLGILLGKLSSDGDEGGGAYAAGSGCLQCLKQEDIMTLIGVVVKGQLGDLQSQLTSQNQQIIAMHEQRVLQESQVTMLRDQLGVLIAKQERPNDHTLLYINSMEGQLTRVRGQLRNLQLSRLQGYNDVEIEQTEGSKIVLGLSGELKELSKEVSNLQTEMDSFQAQQMMEMSGVQTGSEKFRRDLKALHLSMVSWEERLAMNVTFLEARLTGLLKEVELLQSEDRLTNSKVTELVNRMNDFESGFSDVKIEMHNFRSEFGEMVAMQNLEEKDGRESVDSRLELLKKDVASLKASQADSSELLRAQQQKYQTLGGSLAEVQSEIGLLKISLEDLSVRQVRPVSSSIKQLNIKLAKLESDLSSLQASFLSLQGSDTEKVDKSGWESLHLSISNTERELNIFVADIDSLKIQVGQLRNQVDGFATSQEEQRSQTGAALRELKTDVGELTIKADRMVVLENMQGDADTNSLVQKLSDEVGAVRLDVGRIASLQGGSDIVVGVTNLKSSLTALESQISYFESTQMQMKRTISSSVSELKGEFSQMNQAFGEQSSAMVALNITVASLKQGQDKLTAFATRSEMQDLQAEMTNLKTMIGQLSAAQSNYATSGDVDTLKKQVASIRSKVDSTHTHLTEMSATYTGDSASHSALAADLLKLQGTVQQLEAMMYSDNHEPINLSLLDSRISSLTSILGDNNENLATFLAAGGLGGTGGTNDAIVALQQDLALIRSDTDRLNGLLYTQGQEGESVSAIAALLDRVAGLEASMAGVQTSLGGGGGGNEVRIQQFREEINHLKEDMMRQAAGHHSGAGLGIGVAAIKDELNAAKANITKLQVDVHDCCKNKTGLLGWWMAPWFSQGQRSSGGSVNLSADGSLDEERVKHIVLSALTMYSADKTGMVDYALESAGGSVISTRCSETHYSKTALLSIFGIPLWYMANSPRTVIQPDVQPGNCWAFKGTQGYMVIQLAGIIKPSAFSLEHIPKSLSPTGTIDSAPKEFSVWGLQDDEASESILLGTYSYDQEGPPLQFFAIENSEVEPIPAVELKIHSNHGNLEYTCLYRFRVHGTLHSR
ncbi:uncharacterized protein [Asterias amurensis]|uniref:uncharacterized protein isoform X1 n=2 Tax=Asterias amurensis TaxID=7602 RepID=UPI003AB16D8A